MCDARGDYREKFMNRLVALSGGDVELGLHIGYDKADYHGPALQWMRVKPARRGTLMANTRQSGANLSLIASEEFGQILETTVEQLHRTAPHYAYRAHDVHHIQDYLDYFHILSDAIAQEILSDGITHALFFNVPHLFYDTLYYEVARALGVKTTILSWSQFPGRFFSMNRVHDQGLFDPSKTKAPPYEMEQGTAPDLFYMDDKWQQQGETGKLSARAVAQFLKFLVRRDPAKLLNPRYIRDNLGRMSRIYSQLPDWRDPFAKFFHTSELAYFEHLAEYEKEPVDLSGKYIYVALHNQPEMSTSALGGKWRDQALVIEALARDLPEGWQILVKENPRQGAYARGPMFFHRLSRIPSVRIMPSSASTHAGEWAKSKFMGVELTAKTLGVIGAGNIGSIVCDRALGLRMKVVAYDPFLSEEKAAKMGVEKVELDELLARADFITLHVPLTDQTRNILSKENIAKTKKGVRIINCARGGLVDEEALAEALKSGHVAGAAFDVFSVEPAKENVLFGLPNVVCTPHLGAATTEAQENVALQVAEQMADYLLTGAVQNALNMPSVTAEEAKVMGPWIKLADHLGAFIGQLTDEPIKAINILYDGVASEMNLEALNSAAVSGIMKAVNPDVNMVSAPVIAKERGIQIATTSQDKSGAFEGYMKVTVVTDKRERSIGGTVFSDGKPRFIQIKGINIDAEVGAHMLYTTNKDVPGIIGTLGAVLGEGGVNIANFTLGRNAPGGDAIALLYVDAQVDPAILQKLKDTGLFQQVKPLEFEIA